MTANVAPAMPQMPAARPSIPSTKLTMFMIATIHTIDTEIASQAGSSWTPRNGNVKRSSTTPNETGTAATPSCPPSFPHQGRPRVSSTRPSSIASAAPTRMPR
jgi:hypothetical protein